MSNVETLKISKSDIQNSSFQELSLVNNLVFWVDNKPSQTFSYIYAGMKRAFERLGCETYWFSDQSFPSPQEFDYSNCIFFGAI